MLLIAGDNDILLNLTLKFGPTHMTGSDSNEDHREHILQDISVYSMSINNDLPVDTVQVATLINTS